jgi:hypothetical protein
MAPPIPALAEWGTPHRMEKRGLRKRILWVQFDLCRYSRREEREEKIPGNNKGPVARAGHFLSFFYSTVVVKTNRIFLFFFVFSYFLHKRKNGSHSSICNFSGSYFLVKKLIFLKSSWIFIEENVNS